MTNFKELESQKQILLSQLEGWSAIQLSYRPSPNAWSALQILDHLVRTEENIVNAAKQGLGSPHAIGLRDRMGTLFMYKVFATERKVKVPRSAPQVLPDPNPVFDQVLQRWNWTRSDFEAFSNQVPAEISLSGIFRHPVAGWMGIPQIIDFFYIHMVHHGFQIRRLSSDKPLS